MSSSEEEECPISEDWEQPEDEKLKEIQILEAVEDNDVDSLKTFLDSSRWYTITDNKNTPLLHMAIVRHRVEVFDYLLSLPKYPLELVNAEGRTALMVALTEEVNYDEYYAFQLITKGADTCNDKNLLHCALARDLVGVAELFINRGVDINTGSYRENTPLHICCHRRDEASLVEGVAMLLYYGADPLIRNFDGLTPLDVILRTYVDYTLPAIEQLFYYMFDQFSECDIDAEAFLRAAELESSLFYMITKYVRKVVFTCELPDHLPVMLFRIKTHHLQIIIEEFDYVIEEVLRISPQNRLTLRSKSVFLLLDSHLSSKFAAWLSQMDFHGVTRKVPDCIDSKDSKLNVQEFVLTVLSYGGSICESELERVYEKFGYCDFFKILLHMKMEKQLYREPMRNIMASILYNVTFDMPKMIKQPDLLPREFKRQLKKILPYYTVPSLQPRVPLLVELARDVFRRYFVQRFDIKSANQFYTVLKLLPISVYCRKIITLEQRLY